MATIQISGAVLATRTNPIVSALNVWSRLEPLPLSADIGIALQASVADPCWFLARQYQFAEFQGEDAGSPIDVRVEGEIATLSRYLAGPIDANAAKRASDYSSAGVPLEVQVEREPSRSTHARFAIDAGAHWLRMLRSAGLTNAAQVFRSAYPVTLAAPRDPDFDDAGTAWRALAALGAVDGRALAADLLPLRAADGTITGIPSRVPVASPDADKVKSLAAGWLAWFQSSLSESLTGTSWNPARQEYAAAASASFSTGEVVLSADEYADGRLEWYDFHIQQGVTLGNPATAVAPVSVALSPTLPTPVGYPGKPAERYWEFEDASVSFGGIDGGAVNVARMLLVEYALVFGNDWFVVPVEMPVGSLFRTTKFRVRDTFGVESIVGPSRNADGPAWTMWRLSGPPAVAPAPSFFFLPPVLAQTLESDPVEEVALFRDEMANMAWGVERRVQGATGEPVDRTREPLRAAANQQVDGTVPDASIFYRLSTPVFERWIPLVPVAMPGSSAAALAMQLERRAMLRTLPDGTRVTVQPQGILLRSDLSLAVDRDALRLEEEEVPREGVVVERTFQYARWLDGRSFVWLGRRKSVGKGEGASGLRFDRIDRPSA
jgi:hypothetical protein